MVWDLKIQKKLKRYRQIKFEKYGAVSDRSDKVKKKLHVLQLLLLSKEREFIQMTKALLFDIDDTLYDLAQPFYQAYQEVFLKADEESGKSRDTDWMERLFLASRKYSDEIFAVAQTKKISEEEMFIYRIRQPLADFGEKISGQKAMEFQKAYEKYQRQITLSETIRQLLELCRSQYVLGIITNGLSEHQRNKIQILKLERYIPKEQIFVSGEVGVPKPAPEIFARALHKLGIAPAQAYFIGDSFENDMIGAKNAGMSAIWFHRRGPFVSGEIQPDYTVTSESELYSLIQKQFIPQKI